VLCRRSSSAWPLASAPFSVPKGKLGPSYNFSPHLEVPSQWQGWTRGVAASKRGARPGNGRIAAASSGCSDFCRVVLVVPKDDHTDS